MTQRSHETAPGSAPSQAEVIPFVIGWTEREKITLRRFCADLQARSLATHSEIGHTDRNEPQFYVFNGTVPDAFLTVSRILVSGKRRYIVENRYGHVLTEGASLRRVIFSLLHLRASAESGSGGKKFGWLVAGLAAEMMAFAMELTVQLGMDMDMDLPLVIGGFI